VHKWYVVATQPGREQVANRHLRNQHFEVFLPLRKKSIRHARKMTDRLAPLFPGYLFIQLDPSEAHWRPVNGTYGVKHMISGENRPLALPAGFVETLQANLTLEGSVCHQPSLRKGDQVEVMAGPFATRVGELIDMDDRGRVEVLMRLLSASVPVKTTIDNLLPA
jgi:transcription elongation factor/antiterminator RfaH